MSEIKLTELIAVDTLQKIQDGFSEYTGMAALITDSNGVPITKGSGFTTFCMELTRKSEKGCKLCEQCDRDGALLTLKNKHATVYECHAGLYDYAAPIMVESTFIGSVIGGQVRAEHVNEEKIAGLANKYGINPDEYISAAKATKYIRHLEIERAARFLEVIATSISEMAYTNYKALKESERLEKISKSQSEFVMNMSLNLENSLEHWFEIVEKTINETEQQEVRELLLAMQDEGFETRSGIKDSVDYIRMYAGEIELNESVYQMGTLKQLLEKGLEKLLSDETLAISLKLEDDYSKSYFGDVGRIGQLIIQIVKTLCEKKTNGEIEIGISIEKKAYASVMNIEIIDKAVNYLSQDVLHFKEHFAGEYEGGKDKEFDDEESQLQSFESMLMKALNGKLDIELVEKDMYVNIRVPQLAI